MPYPSYELLVICSTPLALAGERTIGISWPSLRVRFGILDICLGAIPKFPSVPKDGLYEEVLECILGLLDVANCLRGVGERCLDRRDIRLILLSIFMN